MILYAKTDSIEYLLKRVGHDFLVQRYFDQLITFALNMQKF